jgi:hypothetical protein
MYSSSDKEDQVLVDKRTVKINVKEFAARFRSKREV